MNVMYFSYQPYFLELAEQMKDCGWNPVYWSVVPASVNEVNARFPDAICHNHYDAIRGIPAAEYQNKPLKTVCPTFFDKLLGDEKIALRMFERNDSHTNSFTYRERLDLYQYMVQYWKMIVEDLKPQYVIFEEEPHQTSDYVLYAVCKQMGVETIMFIRTKFHETMYPVRQFEKGSEAILKDVNELISLKTGSVVLSEDMDKYFSSLQGSYENAIALHLYDQVGEVSNILSGRLSVLSSLKSKVKGLVEKLNYPDMVHRWRLMFSEPGTVFLSDQKLRNKPFRDSKMRYIQFLYYKFKAIQKKKMLKEVYHRAASQDYDLNQTYVFCALHYQPEKTTCPLGGPFDDQLYMLRLLSDSLPEGWFLYVKDHPSQFVSSYSRYGEHFRSVEFYESIAELPNVRLLPLESDAFELIDKSKAIATVTGTSAWEGVVRGKPALVFGHCWFKHCEGVFYTPTLDDINEVFDKICNGYSVDVDRVRCFAKAVEDNAFPGLVGGPGLTKYFNVTDKENGVAHAKAVKSLLSQAN